MVTSFGGRGWILEKEKEPAPFLHKSFCFFCMRSYGVKVLDSGGGKYEGDWGVYEHV